VWRKFSAEDVTGLAAEMSYYFVLSMFPFLMVLAALVGTLPFTGVL
jgi:membrane protein